MPRQPQTVAKATFTALDPGGGSITVDFNPSSLTYSIDNSIVQQSGSPKKVQYVAQFSGKLSMELQFDTTDTGSDVRIKTNQVARFMQASANASADAQNASAGGADAADSAKAPPSAPAKALSVLSFQWGTYIFKGILESFKETIDFFSADGVALRALVSITLARLDKVFDEEAKFSQAGTGASLVPSGSGDSALSIATRGGDPSAARRLAGDNGLESLRFTNGGQLAVGSGVQLNAAAGFTADAAAGAGAGFGISAGAILSTQAGSGALFGSGASAKVAASAGAFSGLAVGRATASSTDRLDPARIIASTSSSNLAAFPGSHVALGGAAKAASSPGLSADVGARFRLRDRLTFDTDD